MSSAPEAVHSDDLRAARAERIGSAMAVWDAPEPRRAPRPFDATPGSRGSLFRRDTLSTLLGRRPRPVTGGVRAL
ncbi:MAG: hypothetical protein R6X22_00735 [Gemmatimonadota bacterium]